MENEIIEEKLSFGEKVKCFFVNPTKFFEQYVEKPKFGVMFIVIAIVTWVCSVTTYMISSDKLKQYYMDYMQKILSNGSQPVTQQQLDMTYKITSITQIVTIIFSPAGAFLAIALVALIFFLLNKIFKGEAKYSQLISVCAHAYIITLFYGVFTTIVLLITKNVTNPYDLKNSLSYTSLLSKYINIFSLWKLVVTIFGVAVVSKLPKKKAAIIVIIVFLLGAIYTFGNVAIGQAALSRQQSIQNTQSNS